ncbi:MAG: type III-B CRISPR module RAMP protein Cmr6 [Bryobacteraceae bacterium]
MSRFSVSRDAAPKAHPGLRLDKFLDIKEPEWSEVAGQKLDDSAYRLAYARWEEHWKRNPPAGRILQKGRVRGRLVLGLGAKGVLEVGLRLSHSYGTPVIPASAIKGVLHDAVEGEGLRSFLFGGQDSMGFVDFQDAWWVPESRSPLALDVITVHHPRYYTGEAPPLDSDNPTPVHFLSVRGTFLFVADAPDEKWKDFLGKVLAQTLEKRGIGAKTAAGYGRFVFGG